MKGSFGLGLGVNAGGLGEIITKQSEIILPDQLERLDWLKRLADFASIEVGGGYRVLGSLPGQSKWVWGVGGKLSIPLDKFWAWAKK